HHLAAAPPAPQRLLPTLHRPSAPRLPAAGRRPPVVPVRRGRPPATLCQALYATLPTYDALRRRLPALLRASLPRALTRHRGRRPPLPAAGPLPVRPSGAGAGPDGRRSGWADRHPDLLPSLPQRPLHLPRGQPAEADSASDHSGAAAQLRRPRRQARSLRLGV